MVQNTIKINDVNLPILEEGGVNYYPISYIGNKVLLKDISPSQLKRNGYDKYIKEFNIYYGENTGGSQLTYCISEEGLKQMLSNCKVARLSVEQKKAMQNVCKYLNLKINIDTEEKFIDSLPEQIWQKYDFWTKECIESVLNIEPNIKWQRCSKCGRYYPYNKCFFPKEKNPNNKQPFRTKCNECSKLHIMYYNKKEFTNAYYEGGEILYKLYKDNNLNIYNVYNLYYEGKIEKYPSILRNNINVINIIKKYYRQIILDNINIISKDYISQISKIPRIYISDKALNKFIESSIKKKELLNTNISLETREIKNIGIKHLISKMTCDEAISLANTYLLNNNININETNVYTFDYNLLFKDAKILWYVLNIEKDKLGFIMKLFNNQYGAYKFKSIKGQNYWKNRDNADIAMKYLIEKDLKIPIEKIPLYITKNNLHIKCPTLYNILYNKRFDSCLFDWINRIYPNKFIEEDFSIGIIRNKFDSMEEQLIDKLLREKFKNVIYNNRQGDNIITILHMQPDWFIFTSYNIYIIEYFGIALANTKYNKRISDYIDRTEEKIEKYKNLPYGKTIYLYPEDIKGDAGGFYEKISIVK